MSDEKKKVDTGGSALPHPYTTRAGGITFENIAPGMTLLDYFAVAAVGSLAKQYATEFSPELAVRAYDVAEAMIAEKRKREGAE